MVARQQHGRHLAPIGQGFRPAVVRAVQQAVRKTVLLVRLRIAQHAVLQAGDSIQQRQRRQFTAGQHKVAKAQLLRHMAVQHALVDALVTAAEHDGAGARGQLAHQRLLDASAGGREMDDGWLCLAAVGLGSGQRLLQRLHQHDHAGAAAVGPVVDTAVVVLGEVAQRPEAHIDLAALEGTPRHAMREMRRKQLREDRQDVEAHGLRIRSPDPSRP
mmetsp:Transcript_11763/g.27505  ORF Transcript_11763/g.27505 Transcript_11763/m.27505 type:complete len:216 (-) Transcript_11763:2284-2931(-)